ncbi:MAG: OsmC family protein [Candidatus Marinimicrobia bacterium]|nr:OsmC family protein [Candidatus Neomarinimicrobiota bacterium]MCF7829736.1 OsmC family protein [Candidatus Neomarinimicrobiota bacterium]MCF7881686.1 OsmC family protein [Candidatus Neomarinimicrobiota bacterium]
MENTQVETKVPGLETNGEISMRNRQEPLKQRYREAPGEAKIVDWAGTVGGTDPDAVHGEIDFGHSTGGAEDDALYPWGNPGDEEYDVQLETGIHRAVGGDHDLPNPGNLLCAALATCLHSTIRMIANYMQIPLQELEVKVSSMADVRGTLRVDPDVPVQFQQMRAYITIQAADGVPQKAVKKLLKASEYSCVNLQTLRNGVAVETEYEFGE